MMRSVRVFVTVALGMALAAIAAPNQLTTAACADTLPNGKGIIQDICGHSGGGRPFYEHADASVRTVQLTIRDRGQPRSDCRIVISQNGVVVMTAGPGDPLRMPLPVNAGDVFRYECKTGAGGCRYSFRFRRL